MWYGMWGVVSQGGDNGIEIKMICKIFRRVEELLLYVFLLIAIIIMYINLSEISYMSCPVELFAPSSWPLLYTLLIRAGHQSHPS
jgi:hypothetical protein